MSEEDPIVLEPVLPAGWNRGFAVYEAICGVQHELSKVGIQKTHKNHQGNGFFFRGIDDVYNALAPLLPKYNLSILPRMLNRTLDVRQSSAGNPLFSVTVEAEFDFVCALDGSKHTVKTFGEAMDSGDKATSKAMSAAYKYACFLAFTIPTFGDNDADATTYELAPLRDKKTAKVVENKNPYMLTEEEIANITALAQEVQADVKAINDYYHVASLKFIPRAKYKTIIANLEKQRNVDKDKTEKEKTK